MLNILKFCFSYAVCLLPNFVSGLLGVGLRGDWVRSAATYVTVSFEDILGNGGVSGENSMVLETHFLAVLGM